MVITGIIKKLLVVAVALLPVVAFAVGQPFYSLSTQPHSLSLSYKLEDGEHAFWHDVRDSLRAGETIMVRHRVEITRVRPWMWNEEVATAKATLYVTYNLFENTFMAGPKQDRNRMKMYFDEKTAEEAILSMQHLRIKLAQPLKKGEHYRISVKVQMLADPKHRGWQRYLPIESLFRPQLTQEFDHVAP